MMGKEIKEILFMTAFPNRDIETSTVLVYGKTVEDHHILIWSPKAKRLDCELNMEREDWHFKNVMNINGSIYTTDENYFFKIIDLDYKKEISKSDIEKMFGCEVINK